MQLNHTIVWSTDPKKSSRLLAHLLGRPAPRTMWNFEVVELDNHVSLDFMHHDAPIQGQHYAFLISEAEFDLAFARIKEAGLTYWADPHQRVVGRINHHDSGRGVYFADPDGHQLELITRPYGSG